MSFIRSSQDVRISQEAASFGSRMLAALVDCLIMGIAFYLLIVLFEAFEMTVTHNNLLLVLYLISPFTYPLICETLWGGQTIGKRVMKIRVVDFEGGGPKLTSFLLRWLMLPVDAILSCGVGPLCMFFTKRQQRLGDLVAGTWVVRTRVFHRHSFSLDDYSNEGSEGYAITYPNVRNLTPRQAALISETLDYINDDEVSIASHDLAKSVEGIVGQRKENMTSYDFLYTVLYDYRHIYTPVKG